MCLVGALPISSASGMAAAENAAVVLSAGFSRAIYRTKAADSTSLYAGKRMLVSVALPGNGMARTICLPWGEWERGGSCISRRCDLCPSHCRASGSELERGSDGSRRWSSHLHARSRPLHSKSVNWGGITGNRTNEPVDITRPSFSGRESLGDDSQSPAGDKGGYRHPAAAYRGVRGRGPDAGRMCEWRPCQQHYRKKALGGHHLARATAG